MPRPTLFERFARWLAPSAETRSDFGGSFNLGTAAPGSLAIRTLAGDQINARTALSISAVWAAVNCYTNTLGSLDWYVAERDGRHGRRPAPEHPAFQLLKLRPNNNTTSMRLRQAWVGHACTIGNGYLEIVRDPRDRDPVALLLMDPRDLVACERDGETYYRQRSGGAELRSRDVLHLAMFGWDGLSGYSPIEVGRETLGVASSQRDYQAGLYSNSAGMQGHLEIPGNMKSIDVAALRTNFNKIHQGPANAGNVGILEGGVKWVQTQFSPQDAEIILGAKLSVEEVSRLWNLPQHKLNLLDHATFSNVEELNIDFFQSSILPWVIAIGQECDLKLIAEPDRVSYFTYLDVSTLTRGNTATQTAQETADLASGVRSLNEVRTARGLNPIDDERADWNWVPVNNLQALQQMGSLEAAARGEPAVVGEPVDDVQAAALNGAQIASLLSIVSQVTLGTIPADTAKGMIGASFPTLSAAQVDEILGPLAGFTPAAPVPAPDATVPAPAPPDASAMRDLLADSLGRAIHRDADAARKASRRDRFDLWLEAGDGPHLDSMLSVIRPAARACNLDPVAIVKSVVSRSRAQLRDLVTCVPPDELPDAVNRLCARWECGRAADLATELLAAENRP